MDNQSRRLRRRGWWAGLAAITVVGIGTPALADGIPLGPPGGLPVYPPTTPPSATPVQDLGPVGSQTPVLTFAGSVGSGPIVDDPVPLVCATGCSEYAFDVPPEGVGTPVLVAVKSTIAGPEGEFNPNDGFVLYVYGPDHSLASDANGIGANGQAAEVTPSAPGQYTIVVTYLYAEDPGAAYTGEVRLMSGSSWSPAAPTCGVSVGTVTGCFDLPQLRVLPAYAVTASGIPPVPSTPVGFPVPLNLPLPTSCYADEMVGLDNLQVNGLTQPTSRCLRFTTDIQNIGAGPLTAEIPVAAAGADGSLEVGYLPGDCYANQVVTEAGGAQVTMPAGQCEFHLEHGHFHYDALLGYSLYQAGPGDTPGAAVTTSHKESFCLTDDDYFGFGTAGPNGPRDNVGQPDCNLPRTVNPVQPGQPGTGTFVQEGITPGWGDVYTWDTPDQYIDVTNVPSGTYDIVEETNPGGAILVAGPAQTCALTKIQLTTGPLSDTVQVVGSAPSIPCPGS